MASRYSAVIITLNEEENIERCIKALQEITHDIVVVDAESKDSTVELAQNLGASVYVLPWKGYGPAKNFGISRCKNDWIISVDADEFVSEKLKNALLRTHLQEGHVYAVNILPNYCGKWIWHGSWHPDWNIRVFNRTEVMWNDNVVHEKLIGLEFKKVARLEGKLMHYSYKSIEEHKEKVEYYAKLGAQDLIDKNKSPGLLKVAFGPSFRFVKSYILRLGFLDGKFGYIIAKMEAGLVRTRNKYFKELRDTK